MNQQEILKKIGGIIAELKDQYVYLEAAGNEFNELELELFMANATFLTDHIGILRKIYGQAKPAAAPILSAEKVYGQKPENPDYFTQGEQSVYAEGPFPVTVKSSPVIEITENPSTETPIAETTQEETTQQEVILFAEVMPQDKADDFTVAEDASFTIQKTPIAEKPAEEVLVPDIEIFPGFISQPETNIQPATEPEPIVYAEEKQPETAKPQTEPVLTLNQQIAAQKGLDQPKTAAPATQNKPVQDLQSLISLNDKLLFVKELFNGYNLAYSEAVNILNRYTTFEQAEQFLNLNYTAKNNWKEKPATAERFFDLLRKRFA